MINKPKGTQDILPETTTKIQRIEDIFRSRAHVFGFSEIRTPIFEHTELFARSAGEGSDIVNKEMYTFTDKGDRSLTLKPEGTAGVARAFIENGLGNTQLPLKLWYNTPVFRYERPQAGRYRQHHQLGCELFGSPLPEADFEVISLANSFFYSLKIKDIKLFINSIGCSDCRAKYIEALKEYYQKNSDKLCGTCHTRLEKNTLRVLDCKEEKCIEVNKKAPLITDYLCENCSAHFARLQTLLNNAKINFEVDPRIVRGLDYYTGTVFEFVTDAIGAKSTVCGGGRYDNLIEELGGKSTPAAGFGLGIERLLLLLEKNETEKLDYDQNRLKVYFAVMDDEARATAFQFMREFRLSGFAGQRTETDLLNRSLKAQLKYAAGIDAEFTVILGEDEMKSRRATVKEMATGKQESVDFSKLIDYIDEIKGW